MRLYVNLTVPSQGMQLIVSERRSIHSACICSSFFSMFLTLDYKDHKKPADYSRLGDAFEACKVT